MKLDVVARVVGFAGAGTGLAAAGDLLPLPERNYMTTGGYVLAVLILCVTWVIVRRIDGATTVAVSANDSAKKLEDVVPHLIEVVQQASSHAEQAKELSRPTGNGFATGLTIAVGQISKQLERIEDRLTAVEDTIKERP